MRLLGIALAAFLRAAIVAGLAFGGLMALMLGAM